VPRTRQSAFVRGAVFAGDTGSAFVLCRAIIFSFSENASSHLSSRDFWRKRSICMGRVCQLPNRLLNDHTRVLNERTLLLHGHDRKRDNLEQAQTNLRQAVTEYHASVMGHGILISELNRPVRLIEDHLSLPSLT
jgi:hypothetical protein